MGLPLPLETLVALQTTTSQIQPLRDCYCTDLDLRQSAVPRVEISSLLQFQQLQPQKHRKETTTSSSAATCSVAYSTESPLRTYFWLLALYKSLVEVDGGLFCNQESEGFFWMVEFISWAHSRHIGYKHLEMFSLFEM